jgi:predicted DCC family thiol-disulfide oxidoreductase YuxK
MPALNEHPGSETPSTTGDQQQAVLIFDGDCGFCRRWIARWRQMTGDQVEYIASQAPVVPQRYPDIPAEWYKEGVVLVEPGCQPIRCAEAVLRTLQLAPGSFGAGMWCYRNVPGFAFLSEAMYGVIARHRGAANELTRLLWFGRTQLSRMALTRWIFLRGMALIYLCAFASLAVQVRGLAGEQGILPARRYFDAAREQLGRSGFWQLPSLFWWTGASDSALQATCYAGIVLSLLLLLGLAQVPVLVLLWFLYLSLCGAGQEFLEFQWDLLLLEVGFLAIFVAPLTFRPRRPLNESEPRPLAIWMLRWTAARFMFQSGIVKILSGDPTWRDLTALGYHFETQPLPTPLGYFMHHAPGWFLSANTLAMYAIEIGLAFFVFGPRGLRIVAATGFVLLQIIILLTGNYGFFNWLSIVLCIPLLDDFVWPWKCGGKRLLAPAAYPGQSYPIALRWPRWVLVPAATLVFLVTATMALLQLGAREWTPAPIIAVAAATQPFRTLNSYGLFAVMTKERPEISIEGSADGSTWKPYTFRYKPGPLDRPPPVCEPHMPRLDWQMWFAALGSARHSQWLLAFEEKLLQGKAVVYDLLPANQPFSPTLPPKFVRAQIAQYHFSEYPTLRTSGQWWRRDSPASYSPVLTLRDGRLAIANDIEGTEPQR